MEVVIKAIKATKATRAIKAIRPIRGIKVTTAIEAMAIKVKVDIGAMAIRVTITETKATVLHLHLTTSKAIITMDREGAEMEIGEVATLMDTAAAGEEEVGLGTSWASGYASPHSVR